MNKTKAILIRIFFCVLILVAVFLLVSLIVDSYQDVTDKMERCHEKGWDGMEDVGGLMRTEWVCYNRTQAEKDIMPEDQND